MTKKSPTIVFFGSGPVAAESLKLLFQSFEVETVITKPSTKAEMLALVDSPVYTVSSRQELDELFANSAFTSKVAVLIDFGIIISQAVINYFPLGIINSHFSILPEWRGADPITFAILSGQKQTGVSLMKLVQAMDEGDLLGYGEYAIPNTYTTPELTHDLIQLSYGLLRDLLPLYIENPKTVPQNTTERAVSYSRKLTKQDGVIDWTKPANKIEREIRAFIEWPKSRASIGSLDVVITSSKVVKKQIEPCGKFWVENKQLFVSCGKDSLEILTLKPAGKKEMPVKAFLAGYNDRIK